MPQTLHRAVKRQGAQGAPLPYIYESFSQNRIFFRKSALSMIAGLPGNYKSTLMYNLICQWARKGWSDGSPIIILVVAADSDQHQVASLTAAMMSGDRTEDTEKTVKSGGYDDYLSQIASIEWEFKPLSIDQIAIRMQSVEQRWGRFPDLVVVDNLMNCVAGPGDWKGQIEMTRDLGVIAMTRECHVMLLHHTQEHLLKQEDIGYPPPRWDIQGKVNQFPKLILTVATAMAPDGESGVLRVAPVKNRSGVDDMTGRTYLQFEITPPNGRIRGIPQEDSFYG